MLSQVDNAIKNSWQSQQRAYAYADSLAATAEVLPDSSKKLKLLLRSADEYRKLDLRQALTTLLAARKLACKLGNNRCDSIRIILKLASLYNAQGRMLNEATDIYNNINPEKVPEKLLLEYYIIGVQIHHNLSERTFNPAMKDRYQKVASSLRDSVLKIDPSRPIIAANKLLEKGEKEKALQLMLSSPPKQGERLGPYYQYVGSLYGQLEKPDSQLYYLAKASTDDLERGVKEYVALAELAQLISKSDLDRSLNYISQSRQDARESNSDLRLSQIGPIYAHISNAYYARQQQWLTAGSVMSSSLLVILVLIAFGVRTLRKKNRELSLQSEQLRISHAKTDLANEELASANLRLEGESHIKEYYIRNFMNLCLSYLAKMEGYRARIGKIASGGDINKLMQEINSTRYVNHEIAEFYQEFDKAFLSLYPDFISILNSLLQEDKRYQDNEKLGTELRVYALLWLGIESSGEIAKFLRCSESTVYNYRTQMRNRATDRTNFESQFINISLRRRHKLST